MTNAIYEAGFGSSSRAYEGAQLGMTPARFAKGGKGEKIGWATARVAVWLGDCGSDGARAVLAGAGRHGGRGRGQPARGVSAGRAAARSVACRAGGRGGGIALRDGADARKAETGRRRLDLRGTAFQLRVWQALRRFRAARRAATANWRARWAMPNATRAVARACALNRVSVLVPCHRVVGAERFAHRLPVGRGAQAPTAGGGTGLRRRHGSLQGLQRGVPPFPPLFWLNSSVDWN